MRNSDAPLTVVFFHADWCGSCRIVAPVVRRIAREQRDLALRDVDVAAEEDVARMHSVRSLPTLILLGSGDRELGRLTGTMTGETIKLALARARSETRAC